MARPGGKQNAPVRKGPPGLRSEPVPDVKETVIEMLRIEQDRLGRAIAVLTDDRDTGSTHRRRSGPSVRTRVIDLLENEQRSWTVTEALGALESQGQPVLSVDPRWLVSVTLSGLVRGRLAVRVGPGTYRAAKSAGQHSATQPP